MTTQGGLEGIRTAKKVFYRNFANYRYIICSYEVLITKNTKEEKFQPSEKLHSKGGPLGRRRSEKNFGRNFANYLYIRSRYWVLITKNAKLYKIQTIKKLTPQGGTLGASEVEKSFWTKFSTGTRYSESLCDTHHKKHKISENCNNRKNDPPRGDPWTPKMLISQVLSFEPGHPYFLSIF